MLGLSFPSRDQTHIPCIGRQILNHWTTKKVPGWLFEGLIPQQLPHLTFLSAVHKGSSVPTSSLAAVMGHGFDCSHPSGVQLCVAVVFWKTSSLWTSYESSTMNALLWESSILHIIYFHHLEDAAKPHYAAMKKE